MNGNQKHKRRAGTAAKRLLSMILTMLVLLTCLPLGASANQTEDGNPFTDVKPSSWYYNAVQYVYEKGIFQGTSPTTFSLGTGMTRAMFVTALGRFAEVDASAYSGTGGFSDVDPDAYYAPYVAWAAEKGITTGVGGGRFAVNSLITREQIAKFAANYIDAYEIELPGEDTEKAPPVDLQTVSDWAKEPLLKLWNVGIFNGNDEGLFSPHANMRRCEAAQFFMNMDQVIHSKENPEPEPTVSPSPGTGGNAYFTVTFNSSGGPSIDSVRVRRGSTINSVPQPARDGYVFAGWYTDAGFTKKFDATKAVTANVTLYAQYIDLGGPVQKQSMDENLQLPEIVEDDPVQTDFAVTLGAPGLTLDQVKAGLRLTVTSGMDDKAVIVTGSDPEFTVTMTEGWTPGAAYKLELTDPDISFEKDATATARLYYFTVDRAQSNELALNDIIYIPSTAVSGIVVDGENMESISSGIYNFDSDGSQNNQPLVGSFTYGGNKTLAVGDILCVYDGKSPENALMGETLYDNIAYIKVTGVTGDTIDFTNAEPEEVLAVPKTALVRKGDVSNYTSAAGSFSFTSGTNQFDSFTVGDDAAVSRPLEIGDTIALYDGADFLSITDPSAITMGRVKTITGTGPYTITCDTVTAEDLEKQVDYHQTAPLDAGDLMDQGYIDEDEIVKQIEKQAYSSGMIQELANQYALLALETDLLEDEQQSADGLTVLMEDGSHADAGQLRQIMQDPKQAKGVSVEKPKVETKITKGGGKYGNSALVATLTITFAVKMENANKDSIAIDFEIKFTQEVYLGVGADAGISWHKVWGVPVWPKDVWISAYLDTKTYSAVNLKATANTKLAKPEKIKDPDTGKEIEVTEKKLDVASKINKIIDSFDEKEAYDEVSGIYKTYQDFMANDWTYVEIVRTTLMKVPISLAGGLVKIDVGMDFVLSAALNVSLTCKLSYQDGTRYSLNVSLGGPKVTFTQTQIVDKKFNFDVFFVGRFGLKAGIELYLKVGLVSTKLNSVGVMVQVGVYLEWMGFFSYQYEKNFSANTSSSVAQGAMYAEIGIYLDANAEAQAGDGKWKVTIDLLSLQFPILSTESKDYVYGYSFKLDDGEKLIISKTKNVIPENLLKMIQLDLKGGKSYLSPYPKDRFQISFTDSAFSLTPDNKIAVNTTKDYLETEMIIVWKGSPLAFTSMPLILKVPVVFTNSDQLVEKGLLTVKDQNDTVIWEKRVAYGENITDALPAKAEILNLLGYDNFIVQLANSSTVNLKYSDEGGYTTTPSGVVSGNAEFVYQIPERMYSVTVQDIQNTGGSTTSQSFNAKYGEKFDLSFLSTTGTEIPGTAYTKYSKVQTRKGADAEGLSIQDALTRDLAVQLLDGSHTYHAVYDDDSATVTYKFLTLEGNGIPKHKEQLRRGTMASFDYLSHIAGVNAGEYLLFDLDRDMSRPVSEDCIVTLICVPQDGYKLYYTLNGGKFITGYNAPVSYNPMDITPLPAQDKLEKDGHVFIGWFESADFSGDPATQITGNLGSKRLYAMWRPPEYSVVFDANGGTGTMANMSAKHGVSFNLTPNAFTDGGYTVDAAFAGWNTKPDGSGDSYPDGAEITTPQIGKNGEVTLYAQWQDAQVTYTPHDSSATVPTGAMPLTRAMQLCAQEPGTIELPSESLHLQKTLDLPDGTVLDGKWDMRIYQWSSNSGPNHIRLNGDFYAFEIAEGREVEIKNLCLMNSFRMISNSGTLRLQDIYISGSSDKIYNSNTGKLTLKYVGMRQVGGRAVHNEGSVVIDNCYFEDISASNGPVLFNDGGTAVVNNTSIANSTASGYGGAIYSKDGDLYVMNTTASSNYASAENGGGFVAAEGSGVAHVINSILGGNQEGSGYDLNSVRGLSGAEVHVSNCVLRHTSDVTTQNSCYTDRADGTSSSSRIFNNMNGTSVLRRRANCNEHGSDPRSTWNGFLRYVQLESNNSTAINTAIATHSISTYLDYSDMDMIHIGYGAMQSITALRNAPQAGHVVQEYLLGLARDPANNRVGNS